MQFIETINSSSQAVTLLSLSDWRAQRASWPSERAVALSLPNDADPADVASDLQRFAFVALSFPKWTDGRAYSQAHLLRSRMKFQGQVRATGEVLVDMLPLLQRTGFDAVVLKEGQSVEAAQRALNFFAGHYQRDVGDGKPVFAANRHVGETAAQASAA